MIIFILNCIILLLLEFSSNTRLYFKIFSTIFYWALKVCSAVRLTFQNLIFSLNRFSFLFFFISFKAIWKPSFPLFYKSQFFFFFLIITFSFIFFNLQNQITFKMKFWIEINVVLVDKLSVRDFISPKYNFKSLTQTLLLFGLQDLFFFFFCKSCAFVSFSYWQSVRWRPIKKFQTVHENRYKNKRNKPN